MSDEESCKTGTSDGRIGVAHEREGGRGIDKHEATGTNKVNKFNTDYATAKIESSESSPAHGRGVSVSINGEQKKPRKPVKINDNIPDGHMLLFGYHDGYLLMTRVTCKNGFVASFEHNAEETEPKEFAYRTSWDIGDNIVSVKISVHFFVSLKKSFHSKFCASLKRVFNSVLEFEHHSKESAGQMMSNTEHVISKLQSVIGPFDSKELQVKEERINEKQNKGNITPIHDALDTFVDSSKNLRRKMSNLAILEEADQRDGEEMSSPTADEPNELTDVSTKPSLQTTPNVSSQLNSTTRNQSESLGKSQAFDKPKRVQQLSVFNPSFRKSRSTFPGATIHSACRDGNLQIVKNFISEYPAAVHVATKQGDRPLMLASGEGHYDVVEYLLDHDADINVKNNRGETPLILACRKSLLHGTLDRERPPEMLHLGNALASDLQLPKKNLPDSNVIYIKIVTLLLTHGADANAIDKDGFTPLILACIFGDLKVTDLLVSHDVDINCQGILGAPALTWACLFSYDKITQKLLNQRRPSTK